MTTLYRRLLGPAFSSLPPTLRSLHDVATEWRGTARFRVTRGPGWLRNRLANLAGLPPAGEAELRLRVVAEGERERWIRQFGGLKIESLQWIRGELLVEQFGPWRFGYKVVVEPPALRLVQVRTWGLGVPWPTWLGPRGVGEEVGRDDGCWIAVQALAPLLGVLVRYEGLLVGA
jgi:hypothetical protein